MHGSRLVRSGILARSGAAAFAGTVANARSNRPRPRNRLHHPSLGTRDTYDIGQVTCDWLRYHGMADPIVHFTQDKKSVLVRKLNIGLFVDDRHENCQDVATETDALVLMPHRPYNQAFDHPKVRRIQQLDELFDYLSDK